MPADTYELLTRAFAAVLPAYAVWIAGRGLFLLLRRKDRVLRLSREAALWVLILYLLTLLEITVGRGGNALIRLEGLSERLGHVNLVPLTGVVRMIRYAAAPVAAFNVLGNLIWFLPAGFLPPAIWPGLRRFFPAAAAGAALSFFIELAQLLSGAGVTDVDDLILNTAGTMAGYGFFKVAQAWIRRRKRQV